MRPMVLIRVLRLLLVVLGPMVELHQDSQLLRKAGLNYRKMSVFKSNCK